MTKLRQTVNPADKASWTEHFYTGSLKVTNGEVETDNLAWVSLLQERGFRVVADDEPKTKKGRRTAQTDADEMKEQLEKAEKAVDKSEVVNDVPELPQIPLEESKADGEHPALGTPTGE